MKALCLFIYSRRLTLPMTLRKCIPHVTLLFISRDRPPTLSKVSSTLHIRQNFRLTPEWSTYSHLLPLIFSRKVRLLYISQVPLTTLGGPSDVQLSDFPGRFQVVHTRSSERITSYLVYLRERPETLGDTITSLSFRVLLGWRDK